MSTPQAAVHPSPEVLRKLHRIGELNDFELNQLAICLEVFHAPQDTRLIELGSKDETTLYLLSGKVELKAGDGKKHHMLATDKEALDPICHLRPARYQVTSLSHIDYLLVENDILNDFLPYEEGSSVQVDENYLINESSDNYTDIKSDNALMMSIIDDLNDDKLFLPSLQDVAEKVGQAALNADNDISRLASALMVGPAIAAKIIKTVNTKLTPNQPPISNCEDAVKQLGTEHTVSLIVNYALRETLRLDNPIIAERMQAWWEKSLRVSAISKVLTHLTVHLDPEVAALGGLLHRIGEAIILAYASKLSEPISAKELDTCISTNANEIGRITLTLWNFPHELISIVNESGNLKRSHGQAPDYTDIVLVAELHADIGHQDFHARPFPLPEEVPAFHTLGLHQASAELSVKIIEASTNALDQAESLLVA